MGKNADMILQTADNGSAEVDVTQLKVFIPLSLRELIPLPLESTAPWNVCPGYGEGV